jgi:hypothetical protein
MSRLMNTRRKLVTNTNIIDVINYDTDTTEKIAASKVDLSGILSTGDTLIFAGGVFSKVFRNVPASGLVLNFSRDFTDTEDDDGDYNVLAFGKEGGQNINVEVIQTKSGLTIKPDRDGTTVRIIIAPLNSTLNGASIL